LICTITLVRERSLRAGLPYLNPIGQELSGRPESCPCRGGEHKLPARFCSLDVQGGCGSASFTLTSLRHCAIQMVEHAGLRVSGYLKNAHLNTCQFKRHFYVDAPTQPLFRPGASNEINQGMILLSLKQALDSNLRARHDLAKEYNQRTPCFIDTAARGGAK
jgi:hypothetical protein